MIEQLVRRITGQEELEVRPSGQVVFSPHSAQLWLGKELLGYLGQVSPEAAKALDVRRVPVAAELRVEVLTAQAQLLPHYRPVAETPAIKYDVNYVLPVEVSWAQLRDLVRRTAGSLLERLQYRETYQNQHLARQGRKKLLFSLWFRDHHRTLTHEETNALKARIDQAAAEAFGAQLG